MVSRYEGLLSERQPMLPDSLVQKENIAISKRSRYYFGSVLSFPERLSELIISLSQSSWSNVMGNFTDHAGNIQ